MEIKILKGIPPKQILAAFNAAFSDYFVPFKLTEEQLISKMIADKIDLNVSVGVFENEKLIAFILHGFDVINHQKVIYNGGTGVIPTKRGAGLTKQMYQFALPILVKKGNHKIILEVISENIQAIKSYKKSGFKTTRKLACYKGNCNRLKTNKTITVKELQDYPWKQMESFWDIPPTWQNSKNVMDKLKCTTISLGAYINSVLIGYIIYNPVNRRILQISTDKKHRKKRIASTLISELIKEQGNHFSVINVDRKSENANAFFRSLGFENYLNQFEMELKIDKK